MTVARSRLDKFSQLIVGKYLPLEDVIKLKQVSRNYKKIGLNTISIEVDDTTQINPFVEFPNISDITFQSFTNKSLWKLYYDTIIQDPKGKNTTFLLPHLTNLRIKEPLFLPIQQDAVNDWIDFRDKRQQKILKDTEVINKQIKDENDWIKDEKMKRKEREVIPFTLDILVYDDSKRPLQLDNTDKEGYINQGIRIYPKTGFTNTNVKKLLVNVNKEKALKRYELEKEADNLTYVNSKINELSMNDDTLQTLIIGEGVRKIHNLQANALTRIEIPNSVTEIYTLLTPQLKALHIPEKCQIESIGDLPKLTSLTFNHYEYDIDTSKWIPLEEFDMHTFLWNSTDLRHIVFPRYITKIKYFALNGINPQLYLKGNNINLEKFPHLREIEKENIYPNNENYGYIVNIPKNIAISRNAYPYYFKYYYSGYEFLESYHDNINYNEKIHLITESENIKTTGTKAISFYYYCKKEHPEYLEDFEIFTNELKDMEKYQVPVYRPIILDFFKERKNLYIPGLTIYPEFKEDCEKYILPYLADFPTQQLELLIEMDIAIEELAFFIGKYTTKKNVNWRSFDIPQIITMYELEKNESKYFN